MVVRSRAPSRVRAPSVVRANEGRYRKGESGSEGTGDDGEWRNEGERVVRNRRKDDGGGERYREVREKRREYFEGD